MDKLVRVILHETVASGSIDRPVFRIEKMQLAYNYWREGETYEQALVRIHTDGKYKDPIHKLSLEVVT